MRTPKIRSTGFHAVSETQDSLNRPNANYNDAAEYNSWLHFKVYYMMVFYMNTHKNIT